MTLQDTSLGYPLPHPLNSPFSVDVPRLRHAIQLIDRDVAGLIDALEAKADASDIAAQINAAIAAWVGNAPEAYDTLVEIAAKLNDNDDVVSSLMSQISQKADMAALSAIIGNYDGGAF